jgi:hypothetical protein
MTSTGETIHCDTTEWGCVGRRMQEVNTGGRDFRRVGVGVQHRRLQLPLVLGHRVEQRYPTAKEAHLSLPKLALCLQVRDPIEHLLTIYLTLCCLINPTAVASLARSSHNSAFQRAARFRTARHQSDLTPDHPAGQAKVAEPVGPAERATSNMVALSTLRGCVRDSLPNVDQSCSDVSSPCFALGLRA